MYARVLIVLCALVAGSRADAQQPLQPAQELLHRARVWEVHDRGDLARLALEKLAAARPGSPDVLLELGELNLRLPDMRAAQRVLALLNEKFPGSAQARTFAIEYRFATRDRLQLVSVGRLVQLGRVEEARKDLDRLFPEGAPGGVLSLEYYRLLASTPSGWAPAYAGLKKLAAEHPDDPRYGAALARHLLHNDATVVEGAARLNALVRRDDVRVPEIDDYLSGVLKDARYDFPRGIIDEYLARNPGDLEVRNALHTRERALEQRELLVSGALARIDTDLQQRNLRRLSTGLAALASSKPLAAEGRELSELLEGRVTSQVRTPHSTAVSATWMNAAQESLRAGNLDLAAAQMHAAVALRTGRYEAVIPIASHLEALGERERSGELLGVASRLGADSDWLFATYVRWLIDNQRADDALSLLGGRPVGKRWAPQSRDALRARALNQRAQTHAAAGHSEDAIADLEAAVALAPADPWSRYQLAGFYARTGAPERGRELLGEGVRLAPDNEEMLYAQSLYLASVDDYDAALAAIERIPREDQNEGMIQLHARVSIERARMKAQRLKASGAIGEARATLLDVEPLAQRDVERMRQLAFAWIDLGDVQRALELADNYVYDPTNDHELLIRAEVLDYAGDTAALGLVLDHLRARPLSPEQRDLASRLQTSLDLRRVRALQREGQIKAAAHRVDQMLEGTSPPDDRELRIVRAELELAARNPRAACAQLAALTVERPDDLGTRLTYIRALAEAGDTGMARTQLRTMQMQARADDVDIQLGIARRQLAMGDAAGAGRTIQAVLPIAPQRGDALLLAGHAAEERTDYVAARDYFMQAQRAGDESVAVQARLAEEEIDARLQSWGEAAFEFHEKPGQPGISRFSMSAVPAFWSYARSDGQRFALRTDWIHIDAGRLSDSFDSAALLGTVQAAGPTATRIHENDAQSGLSLGVEYASDTVHADLGTTPRSFLLPQIVWGLEWTPQVGPFVAGLGLASRAVTGSVLSFGGMRDPISGMEWGGVVSTGPYARLALYRERYGISATVSAAELTGTRVPDNRFSGARTTADWTFLARENARAYLGVTVDYWHYDKNLQNYTFGNGGYYSPQSRVSISVPIELQGRLNAWNFRLRASLSHSSSRTDRAAFYPGFPDLQSHAATSPLPEGFDEPYFQAGSSSDLSLSAYAAAERQVSRAFVMGAKVDIDRADYYTPTTYMLYLRHAFGGSAARLTMPPRPVRLYSDY